jgi:phosphosulfolactate synthase
MVLDRFNIIQPELSEIAQYVDTVKIGWGLPILVDEKWLDHRIKFYHSLGVTVSTGGTLLEIAAARGKSSTMIDRAKEIGFDIIEISEGVISLSTTQKRNLVEAVKSAGLECRIEVGRKDPKNQLSLEETVDKMNEALDLNPSIVILESRESGRGVGIYDQNGDIKWDWVNKISSEFETNSIMFEAPIETQQTGLIIHFGPNVNLGNVAFTSIAPLESQRLGLRGDTFGVTRPQRKFSGSPAEKFIYHVIKNYQPIDQTTLIQVTDLPRRTVQNALVRLEKHGIVRANIDTRDSRRRVYTGM